MCPVYINKNYLCVSESRKTKLDQLLQDSSVEKEKDTLYYLRGNAYRKKGDWKRALDNYQYAIELNPDSPAVQARKMAIDILNFYHKDMFNQ
ncbi:MAG: tetratricopeptide repeat protein [Bacteroides sp.]|nr:tetratricopeptide repeat protein [Bacteroides sp.]